MYNIVESAPLAYIKGDYWLVNSYQQGDAKS